MNIVVVDNDVALLKTLEMLFEGLGHTVKTFDNPSEAYFFVKKAGNVDTLIVDYMMPDMDGQELIKMIKTYLPIHCKIILISGFTELVETMNLEEMGVEIFLPKPLDLDDLYSAVGL